jgi:hypothetical protein
MDVKEPLTQLAKTRDPGEDALAAELVRDNLPGPDFDASAKERIRRRLRGQGSLAWRWRLSPALAFGALVLSSLATAAVLYYRPELKELLLPKRNVHAPAVVKPHPRPPSTVVPAAVEPPPAVEVEVPPQPPAAVAEVEPTPHHRPHHRGTIRALPPLPPAPPTAQVSAPVASANAEPATPDIPLTTKPAPVAGGPAPESPRAELTREMPAFRAVLHALNVERDGHAALAALDAYHRDFPSGIFHLEAYAARVDALILLGRRDEALSELQGVSTGALRQMPHGAELSLLRAELVKERGDCTAAMATFDQVLDEGPASLAERALWDRAGCRAAMGKSEESRADLEQYLRLFPKGVFAKKVRAALAAP